MSFDTVASALWWERTAFSVPTPANPAYICVISPSLPQPIVIYGGFSGSAATPHLSWTPDPGTPVGPFGI